MEKSYWESWDEAAGKLEKAKYVFAKTMPKNPHYYTLRKTWDDAEFVRVVKFMRSDETRMMQRSYTEMFGGRPYTQFNVNGWKYWTMGEPINKDGKPWTILINRKHIERGDSYYDYIADEYDELFTTEADAAENKAIFDLIDYQPGESILDLGCGTGLFLDNIPAKEEDYVGVDVSEGMLNRCIRKHAEYETHCVAFEDFYTPRKFDKIISLFGAFSYIDPLYIGKVEHMLNDGGKALLMVYDKDYHPKTYDKMGVEFEYKAFNDSMLADYKVTKFHGYKIIEVKNENI